MLSPPDTDTGPGATRGTRGELGNWLYVRVCGPGGRSGGVRQGLGNRFAAGPQDQARPLHLIHGGASSPFCLTPSFCPIMDTLTRCDTPASCGIRC